MKAFEIFQVAKRIFLIVEGGTKMTFVLQDTFMKDDVPNITLIAKNFNFGIIVRNYKIMLMIFKKRRRE